ncbi:unnamed protein product [Notodromas monacha]|uniref:Small ribosomal subunit protein uS5 n=1 Tax=Notodromas monacha TaxID=399045 RepID=A0A7R9BSX9_9CRUS|nr:unnamed protein product [Notodromas monacha]CAG0919529.1 unnamed protein product [Notodromas monacha]
MADTAPARGGFRGGFGGRGRGRGGRGRGRGRRGGKEGDKEWVPVTKLGRLVKDGKIKSLEEIYLYSLPIKEFEIVDFFLGSSLKDEVLKIMPVQKQTRAGQRTRFKAFVAIGDYNGHIGLGVKCSKEVATAIRGAIILAKLSVIPVRRGYWGNKIAKPHTVPCKVVGKCGSVLVRLIPAPRGTGIVAAAVPKKLLQMAGIEDCYTSARGSTCTLGNFAKATYAAIARTYAYLTPDLWEETRFQKSPYEEHTDYLAKHHKPLGTQRQEQKESEAAEISRSHSLGSLFFRSSAISSCKSMVLDSMKFYRTEQLPCFQDVGFGMKQSLSAAALSSNADIRPFSKNVKAPVTGGLVTAYDPFTAAIEGSDPLSMFAAEEDQSFSVTQRMSHVVDPTPRVGLASSAKLSQDHLEGLEPWHALVVTTTDLVKTHLEQLDDIEEGSVKEMLNLTQQDYVIRIQQLNTELSHAWSTDQRVKSLKIAIQCAKLLTTPDVLNFYPSKFVLVTDLLDNFGNLVFNRLKNKELECSHTSSNGYGVADARDTARNWFYKIASIRELIPRFYLETAILKCYRFFADGDLECRQALVRLALMNRGIGDPLVAVYARSYLSKIATEVLAYKGDRKYLLLCIEDTMATFPQLYSPESKNAVMAQKVEFSAYLNLYTPALDYMLECMALKAHEKLFLDLLAKCKNLGNKG